MSFSRDQDGYLSNDEQEEEKFLCPLCKIYFYSKLRLQTHLPKCRRRYKGHKNYLVCPFDSTHLRPKHEYDEHVKECKEKRGINTTYEHLNSLQREDKSVPEEVGNSHSTEIPSLPNAIKIKAFGNKWERNYESIWGLDPQQKLEWHKAERQRIQNILDDKCYKDIEYPRANGSWITAGEIIEKLRYGSIVNTKKHKPAFPTEKPIKENCKKNANHEAPRPKDSERKKGKTANHSRREFTDIWNQPHPSDSLLDINYYVDHERSVSGKKTENLKSNKEFTQEAVGPNKTLEDSCNPHSDNCTSGEISGGRRSKNGKTKEIIEETVGPYGTSEVSDNPPPDNCISGQQSGARKKRKNRKSNKEITEETVSPYGTSEISSNPSDFRNCKSSEKSGARKETKNQKEFTKKAAGPYGTSAEVSDNPPDNCISGQQSGARKKRKNPKANKEITEEMISPYGTSEISGNPPDFRNCKSSEKSRARIETKDQNKEFTKKAAGPYETSKISDNYTDNCTSGEKSGGLGNKNRKTNKEIIEETVGPYGTSEVSDNPPPDNCMSGQQSGAKKKRKNRKAKEITEEIVSPYRTSEISGNLPDFRNCTYSEKSEAKKRTINQNKEFTKEAAVPYGTSEVSDNHSDNCRSGEQSGARKKRNWINNKEFTKETAAPYGTSEASGNSPSYDCTSGEQSGAKKSKNGKTNEEITKETAGPNVTSEISGNPHLDFNNCASGEKSGAMKKSKNRNKAFSKEATGPYGTSKISDNAPSDINITSGEKSGSRKNGKNKNKEFTKQATGPNEISEVSDDPPNINYCRLIEKYLTKEKGKNIKCEKFSVEIADIDKASLKLEAPIENQVISENSESRNVFKENWSEKSVHTCDKISNFQEVNGDVEASTSLKFQKCIQNDPTGARKKANLKNGNIKNEKESSKKNIEYSESGNLAKQKKKRKDWVEVVSWGRI